MINKSFIDRYSLARLRCLPSWLPYLVGIYTLALMVNSLGTGDGRSFTTATSGVAWSLAVCLNLGLVAVGVISVGKSILCQWDTWSESEKFIDRVWTIAKQVTN